MHVRYNIILLTGLFSLIVGCTSMGSVQLTEQPIQETVSFQLVDARKEGRELPWLAADKPMFYYGDAATSPTKLQYLAHKLETRLGGNLAGKVIEIRQFEIANFYGEHENRRYLAPLYEDRNWITAVIRGSIDGKPFKISNTKLYDIDSILADAVYTSTDIQPVLKQVIDTTVEQTVAEIEGLCGCGVVASNSTGSL